MVKLPNQFDRIPPRFHQNSEELLILDAEKDEENTKAMGEEVVAGWELARLGRSFFAFNHLGWFCNFRRCFFTR